MHPQTQTERSPFSHSLTPALPPPLRQLEPHLLPRSLWKPSAVIKLWLANHGFPTSLPLHWSSFLSGPLKNPPSILTHPSLSLYAAVLPSPQQLWSLHRPSPPSECSELDFPSRNTKPKSSSFVKSFQMNPTLELLVLPILSNQFGFNKFLYMNPLSPPISIINWKIVLKENELMEGLPAFCWGNYGSLSQGPRGYCSTMFHGEPQLGSCSAIFYGEPWPGSCSTMVHGEPGPGTCSAIFYGEPEPGSCSTMVLGEPWPETCSTMFHGESRPGTCSAIFYGEPWPGSCSTMVHGEPQPGTCSAIFYGEPQPGSCSTMVLGEPWPGTCSTMFHGEPRPESCSAIFYWELRPGSYSTVFHGEPQPFSFALSWPPSAGGHLQESSSASQGTKPPPSR